MSYMFKSRIEVFFEEILTRFSRNTEDIAKIPGKVILWVVATLVIFFLFYAVRFDGLSEIESIDYAQIARHVARGEGFTTSNITPYSLLTNASLTHHPDLSTPPLYIFLLAAVFKIFGSSDRAVCLTGGILYLLSVPLLLLMGWKMFSPRAALLSVALYITNSVILDYSVSGGQMPLLIFLFMAFLFNIYSLDQNYIFKSVSAGILLGLLYLTNYSYGLIYFAVMVHMFLLYENMGQKIRHMVFFTLSFLLIITPWLCRNMALTGNPFFTFDWLKPLLFSDAFPGTSILRLARPINFPMRIIAITLVKKIYFGIKGDYFQILTLSQNYIMPLFFISIFVLYQNIKTLILRRFIYVAAAVIAAVSTVFYPGTNLMAPFLPFIIMAAADFFFSSIYDNLLTETGKKHIIVLILFVCVNLYPLITKIVFAGKLATYPRDRMEKVTKITGEDEIIVTDIPWAVAWYCDRTAVWIPYSEADYLIVKRYAGTLNNIYLSPMLFDYPRTENIELWKSIYLTRRVPKEIFLSKGTYLKEGGMFLSVTAKWEEIDKHEEETITGGK